MFVAANYLTPIGARVRLEVTSDRTGSREPGFVLEAVTVRTKIVPAELRSVQQAGFGVRFLQVAELIRELIPGFDDTATEEVPTQGLYRVRFQSVNQFFELVQKELKFGGMFIAATSPAAIDEKVTVEIYLPESGTSPVLRFDARVVNRVDSQQGNGEQNLMSGIGVEFIDRNSVFAELKPLVQRLLKRPSA